MGYRKFDRFKEAGDLCRKAVISIHEAGSGCPPKVQRVRHCCLCPREDYSQLLMDCLMGKLVVARDLFECKALDEALGDLGFGRAQIERSMKDISRRGFGTGGERRKFCV